jgi:hypothetical protein
MLSKALLAVLLGAGGPMSDARLVSSLVDALPADGPRKDRADQMMLYGQLVGHWQVDVYDYEPDGSRHASTGEWIFGWVLEGRAIQDVFIVPARQSGRPASLPVARNRYGTTLRVYDPASDAWQITWINPVRQVRNTLVGRRVGQKIVQEGRDDDGSLMRWVFSEITPGSFRWRGEASSDGGRTWFLGAEFFARRAPRPYASIKAP